MKKFLNNRFVVAGMVVVALGSIFFHSRKDFRRALGPVRSAARIDASAAVQQAEAVLKPALPPTTAPAAPAAVKSIKRDVALARMARWVEAPERDPFAIFPAATVAKPVAKAAPTIQVSAIWRQSGRHLAVINGKVFQEGDTAFDYTVERIENGAVFLRHSTGAERAEFPAFDSFTKTNRAAHAASAAAVAAENARRKANQPGG